jgi:hypothetical protein
MDPYANGYESFVAGSASGLVRNGDPFNLVDAGSMTSSKWMTHTLPLYSDTVYVEVMITVHSQPDSSQPNLRSCISVDYLTTF